MTIPFLICGKHNSRIGKILSAAKRILILQLGLLVEGRREEREILVLLIEEGRIGKKREGRTKTRKRGREGEITVLSWSCTVRLERKNPWPGHPRTNRG